MDALWLPVLWQGDRLDDALNAMKRTNCLGALVEREDDRYEIIKMWSVEQALRNRQNTLADVGDGEPVYLTSLEDASDGIDLVRPLRTGAAYEDLLNRVNCQFALVAQAYDMGLVVTRHETGRRGYSPSSTFYCSGGARTHYFPTPNVRGGQICPKCLGQPKGQIYQR